MRKTILPGALSAVVLATACTPVTNSNANQSAANFNININTNANATSPQTASASDLTEKERQAYDALRRKDWDAFGRFLADDFIYVTGDGVHDRAKTVEMVRNLDLTDFSMTDTRVVNVDRDLAVVTYTSHSKGNYGGRPIDPETMRESSAWINRGGNWLLVYHQDSEVRTAPAPSATTTGATPATSPAQTTAASPTPATTGAATPTDVEKQIWDALKRKDWDGFASHLAADAVEVEPTGVYDKQGSVNGVRQVNFDNVTLSDFREVRLDPDAALVTYTVRGPQPGFGPKGNRHTTIHVNRGGRWLAVFHQGTEIK